MKRILALIVAVFLLFAALPVSFAEETPTLSPLEEEVIKEARDTYIKAQRFAGKRSFHGKCGLFVGTQLRCLGINTKRLSFDGNDNYDYYADLEVTTGGYYAIPYSGVEYDLLSALQEVSDNGKKNVRNILVGFQWTNTLAGSKYGHVMLINGIINGTVYFTESFDSALGGKEGTVLSCTMEAFAKSYNKWTRFDGLIHFGAGNYYDVCVSKETDLMVQARFDTLLRSQPALVGEKECKEIRDIAAGEEFRATAVFGYGRSLYYRVETEDGFGFVSGNAMSVLKANPKGVTLWEEDLPSAMKTGKKAPFSGHVTDDVGLLESVEVCITDSSGQLVRREIAEVLAATAELSVLRKSLWLELLEEGEYQVQVFAIRACPVILRGTETDRYTRILLKNYPLQVGA